MFIKSTLILTFLFCVPVFVIYAQSEVSIDRFNIAINDNYLTISKDNKEIYSWDYLDDKLLSIKIYDLENNGKKQFLIESFNSKKKRFKRRMSIHEINEYGRILTLLEYEWDYNGYELVDLNNDGAIEIKVFPEIYIDVFTDNRPAKHIVNIFNLREGKITLVNNEFPNDIREYISELEHQLVKINEQDIKCDEKSEKGTTTVSGILKEILAAIVMNYSTLSESDKGYETINSTYNCPDKEDYITYLKTNIYNYTRLWINLDY